MWIAIVDSIYFSNQFFVTFTCVLGMPELFVWTTTFTTVTPESKLLALAKFLPSTTLIEMLGLYISMCLNICLQIDLI
jgi:hypothetical protein